MLQRVILPQRGYAASADTHQSLRVLKEVLRGHEPLPSNKPSKPPHMSWDIPKLEVLDPVLGGGGPAEHNAGHVAGCIVGHSHVRACMQDNETTVRGLVHLLQKWL